MVRAYELRSNVTPYHATYVALAEGLRRLLTDADMRRRFAVAARSRAEQKFSLGVMVMRYAELFRSLSLSGKPS